MTNLPNFRVLSLIAVIGATSFAGAGCMMHAHGSANGEAGAPVTYTSRPTLVAVGSGVWVVRASARTTYYVNDSYWVFRDGLWYSSRSYAGGWVVVQVGVVPTVIVNGNHDVYVNFQGDATAATKPAPGDVVAANDPPPKKEKDELPGVGNKSKAAREQPGEVGKGLLKDPPKDQAKDPPKASPPAISARRRYGTGKSRAP